MRCGASRNGNCVVKRGVMTCSIWCAGKWCVCRDVSGNGVRRDASGNGVRRDVRGNGVRCGERENGVRRDVRGNGVRCGDRGNGVRRDVKRGSKTGDWLFQNDYDASIALVLTLGTHLI